MYTVTSKYDLRTLILRSEEELNKGLFRGHLPERLQNLRRTLCNLINLGKCISDEDLIEDICDLSLNWIGEDEEAYPVLRTLRTIAFYERKNVHSTENND